MNSELNGTLLAEASGETPAGETHEGTASAQGSQTAETVHKDDGGLPPFLRFDPGVWIWTVAVFVVLLIILRKMAWGPIISSITEREKTIKDSLDQAARIQVES